MATIEQLRSAIEKAARQETLSLDTKVYAEAGKDPYIPILSGGQLDTPVAFFARDLGRQEVLRGEPLIGDAGQRVRRALYTRLFDAPPPAKDVLLAEAVAHVLLTNTVPYKPVGNKAYPNAVKERFRPFVAQLLTCFWTGDMIFTMGTEAFQWFLPYVASKAEFDAFWKRDDRYESAFPCILRALCEGQERTKAVTLLPLPHPSPLNRTWLERFPGLLEQRLATVFPGDGGRSTPPQAPKTSSG